MQTDTLKQLEEINDELDIALEIYQTNASSLYPMAEEIIARAKEMLNDLRRD